MACCLCADGVKDNDDDDEGQVELSAHDILEIDADQKRQDIEATESAGIAARQSPERKRPEPPVTDEPQEASPGDLRTSCGSADTAIYHPGGGDSSSEASASESSEEHLPLPVSNRSKSQTASSPRSPRQSQAGGGGEVAQAILACGTDPEYYEYAQMAIHSGLDNIEVPHSAAALYSTD